MHPSRIAVVGAVLLLLAGCDRETTPQTALSPGDLPPGFSLTDVNPNSATAGTQVSTSDFNERISCWYFGRATDPYARAQFAKLDSLQTAIGGLSLRTETRILAVNHPDAAAADSVTAVNHFIPLLQDVGTAWSAWRAQPNDLIVLGRDRKVALVLNLTGQSLADTTNYKLLRTRVLSLAVRMPQAGDTLRELALLDVNPNSPTSGMNVSPGSMRGKVTAWWFAVAT